MDFRILEFLLKKVSLDTNQMLTREQESKATQYFRYGRYAIEIDGSEEIHQMGSSKDINEIRKQFLIKGTDFSKLLHTQKSLTKTINCFNTEKLVRKWRNLLFRSLLLMLIFFGGALMMAINFRVIGLLLIGAGGLFLLGLVAYYKLFVSLRPDSVKHLLKDLVILEQAKIALIQTDRVKNENERNEQIDQILNDLYKLNYE